MHYIYRALFFISLFFSNVSILCRCKKPKTLGNGEKLVKYCSSLDTASTQRQLSSANFSKEEIEKALVAVKSVKNKAQNTIVDKYSDMQCPHILWTYLDYLGPAILTLAKTVGYFMAGAFFMYGFLFFFSFGLFALLDHRLAEDIVQNWVMNSFIISPLLMFTSFLLSWTTRKLKNSTVKKVKARKLYKRIETADEIIQMLKDHIQPKQLLTHEKNL